ncbi:MAG: HAD-IIB family hydrolase [Betaproteobacteria bacterium]|nr:HAD-IIB family hydrolase [Betaproteobacteria bacterium]
MKPLAQMDASGVDAVLFDLDDTLSTDGKITAEAYAALESLHQQGLRAVCVTGRPAGWCDHIARMWPVDAVIGENGAFYFWHAQGRLQRRFHDADGVRAEKRTRLSTIARRILAAVPGSALASDQGYRETDLAIDYREDVPPLPLVEAERIARLMKDEGLAAKISSIHVNGWFGDYDKLAMTRLLFRERYALPEDRLRKHVVFVGDSPNDAPMFAYFDRSVGVANVETYGELLAARPKYVTPSPCGRGFAELAATLGRQK